VNLGDALVWAFKQRGIEPIGIIGEHGTAWYSTRSLVEVGGRVLRKILLGFLALVVMVATAVAYSYYSWRGERLEALYTGSQMAETSVGPVEYVLKGNDGPIILFLHGIPGGYDQAPTTSRQGYRLLAPSRPGYLRTPLDAGRTPSQQAQMYLALIDSLGIGEVIVMGASGGGPSAIAFYAMYPDRTTSLILLEAMSQSFPNDGEIMAIVRSDLLYWTMMRAMLGTGGLEGLVASQVSDESNQHLILNNPDKLAEFERVIWSIWPPSERLAGWQNDMGQINDLSLPAKQVRVPTLIIHGTADTQVPFSHSEKLASQIDGARLHAVDGADHMMPIFHREVLNSVIDDFLNSLAE
jgi:pimeloyl-ACP methyl ester carboxylesterase